MVADAHPEFIRYRRRRLHRNRVIERETVNRKWAGVQSLKRHEDVGGAGTNLIVFG